MMPAATLTVGDQVNYTGAIAGYLQNPGTVQPDQGDGLTRILWADGFALSVLAAGDPFFNQLQIVSTPPPPSS